MLKVKTVQPCSNCHQDWSLLVSPESIEVYKKGFLVQDAFPYLSVDEREQIVMRMCEDCVASFWQSVDEETQ